MNEDKYQIQMKIKSSGEWVDYAIETKSYERAMNNLEILFKRRNNDVRLIKTSCEVCREMLK